MGRSRGGDPKCWICGGKGHVQAECPEAVTGHGASARRRCFVCGSDEHVAADCVGNQRRLDAVERWPKVKRVIASPPGPDPPAGPPRCSVLITTSPVPSNPSTMMLEAVLSSFSRVVGLTNCPLVIVCDGFRFSPKSTWKAGQVTEDAAERYAGYLRNLEALLENGTLPPGTRIVVLDGHNGQAMGVQAGLSEVRTPFVLVHQHDLEFLFDFNLTETLDVLEDDSNDVKYIGLQLLVNLHYEAIAWQHHGVRVQEVVHGGLRLVPVVFWYDSTHITLVQHYRTLVFGPGETYKPGNFVEETFGVRQRQDIITHGMAVHPKYGTYHRLSYGPDGSRRPLICHLNGVRFLTPEQRAARGYPADPPVEFFPSRVIMNRKQRKLKQILDAIEGFAGMDKAESSRVRDLLATRLNASRLRGSNPASQCLPSRQPPA